MISSDGVNWTVYDSVLAPDRELKGVVWSPELSLFVIIAGGNPQGDGDFYRVMTSPDGINWTARLAAADIAWGGVCWSPELGIFVAVATTAPAGNPNGRVMTSPDGINWTLRQASASELLSTVIYAAGVPTNTGGKRNIFVATTPLAAAQGRSPFMISEDGINWETGPTGLPAVQWRAIAWSPELSLFTVLEYGTNAFSGCLTSPDAVNWTHHPNSHLPTDLTCYNVVWARELSLFVSVSFGGTGGRVLTSVDGKTWTQRPSALDNTVKWVAVTYAPEINVLVAAAGFDPSQFFMTSGQAPKLTQFSTAHPPLIGGSYTYP